MKHFLITLVVTIAAILGVALALEPDEPPHVRLADRASITHPGPQEAPGSSLGGLQLVAHQLAQNAAIEAQVAAEAAEAAAAEHAAAQIPAPEVSTGTASPASPSGAGSSSCAIPAYICERESGGDPTIYNQSGSGASGKYQFMPGTWNGYGGYATAADAPEHVQDAKARELWDGGAGCSHWSACG